MEFLSLQLCARRPQETALAYMARHERPAQPYWLNILQTHPSLQPHLRRESPSVRLFEPAQLFQ